MIPRISHVSFNAMHGIGSANILALLTSEIPVAFMMVAFVMVGTSKHEATIRTAIRVLIHWNSGPLTGAFQSVAREPIVGLISAEIAVKLLIAPLVGSHMQDLTVQNHKVGGILVKTTTDQSKLSITG